MERTCGMVCNIVMKWCDNNEYSYFSLICIPEIVQVSLSGRVEIALIDCLRAGYSNVKLNQ